MDDVRPVYSTETGRICPDCRAPVAVCACKTNRAEGAMSGIVDGFIRIRREVKGRNGKTVTTISGIGTGKVKVIAAQLKGQCGTGGSVKDGVVIIQGDHREKIKVELQRMGYKVKLAGG